MATLYLNEDLHPDAFVVGARLTVWGADARHAAQVARVRVGERIGIGDGAGRIGWGAVVKASTESVAIIVESVQEDPRPVPELWLVQALAKGDRDELAIQAATELGVSGVTPWRAERSVSVWNGEKIVKGEARWRTVVREAAKQAIRATVPLVSSLTDTARLVAAVRSDPGRTLVLEPSAARSLASVLPSPADDCPRLTLVVGPEGGIAPVELRELELAGAEIVRLGPEVLRTSTAGPAALAAIQALLRRW